MAAPASLNVSTTVTEPTSSAACPSAHPKISSHISRSSKAIGIRVGAPLSVILLLSLCFLLYRERKHKLELQKLGREMSSGRRQYGDEKERRLRLSFANSVPQELEQTHRPPRELHSKELFEVNGMF